MAENDFDGLISIPMGNGEIKAGYIAGSQKVLLIKTGQGGSVFGCENRYLELALKMNGIYGCTVFVFETSNDSREFYEREMRVVREKMGSDAYRIYYMGVSKGGLIGCWYAEGNERIERIASVNAPLMINFHNKTLPALKKLAPKIKMYYGSLDPSYSYTPFASRFVELEIIKGADHGLVGYEKAYEDIARELLDK